MVKNVSNLEYYRRLRGLTQQDLSEMSSVTQTMISVYENKPELLTSCSYKRLKRMANVLGISVEKLVGGKQHGK